MAAVRVKSLTERASAPFSAPGFDDTIPRSSDGGSMKRRQFLGVLGGAATAWPLRAQAQQADRMARLGILVGLREGDPEGELWVKTLLEALPPLGWKRGTNLQIDLRWGSNDLDQVQKAAKELVGLGPDLIQVTTTPATAAVLRETNTIPVVFSIVSDPLGSGFIKSFARPGGNATGFVNIESSMAGKWVELLKELAPGTSRISIVFNPKTAPQSPYYLKSLESAAASVALTSTVVAVNDAVAIEAAITDLGSHPNSALVVLPDIFTATKAQRDLIISLSARHRIPVVYPFALFVRAGGLASYGVDQPDLQRRAAAYVDRVLKGAKPQDLPVQLPTKFELAINLKAAKALDMNVPPTLLARADEVIE